jgi:hypothetical protein
MKKNYLLLLLISFIFVTHMRSQTTEKFEDETAGSTSFTDNGKVFNITSQVMGPFDIYYGATPYGWSGTAPDNRFIDNTGPGASAFNTPIQFTISSAGGVAFTLKSFYAYLATSNVSLNVSGSLIVTGKLAGVTKFTASANSPFNTSGAVNNGFTFINMSTYGGQNNSNVEIDQYVITTTGNIAYVALDAMTWQCPSVTVSQASQANVSCNGGSNGSATVNATGGNGFTYNWSPGNPAGDGTATATGLTAGNWTVTVTNSCGLSNSTVFNITQPATSVTATQSQTNVTCNGGSNGSATVVASGGTGSYTYSWSPSGGTGATTTGRSAGNYTVTITDANGCSIQKAFIITAPAALTATQSQTNVSCNGGSNGSASVIASGGTGSYTYLWAPSGGTGATATGLSVGNYTVTITDTNNCSIQKAFTITAPAVLTATQSQTNVSCNSGSNGSASVIASGGTGSYSYSWSPAGGTGATATGLSAGNYTVTITDTNNCSIQKAFTITAPAVLTATQSQSNLSCNGGSNGSATVVASGGTGSYTYAWAPAGGTGATATGLSAGNYTVTITDTNNCSIQKLFTITAPAALTATQSQLNVSCNGGSNGSASVIASGGTGSYTYSWAPSGGTGATATGLSVGNYTVTITDASNCSIQKFFTITTAADCSIATTWNGTAWSNGIPACNSYAVTINGDYDSAEDGEITACSLTVASGTVTVASGDNFIIKAAVTVSGGLLTFEQNSNLVQSDNISNAGVITYKRNSSSLYGLDYTIWSSPVTGSQTLKDFSPQTADERFYVYNTALAAYSNYLSASGIFGGNPDEETFVTAKGYLIRMPDGLNANSTSVFNGIFTGTPNNGNISIALNSQNTGFNAVGNPYPSPINVQDFLTLNQSNLENGTLYFWRKRNGTSGTTYATVTLAAYVASTAEGGDTSGGAFNSGQEANWVINPGQGFLVKAAPGATSLNFNNSMRRGINNNQFFRTNMDNSLPPLTGQTSKLWLNLTGENNEFRQTAIAYTDVTTQGLDYGYDGRLIDDGVIALYSVAEDTKLTIQAREAFNADDEVALGFRTSAEGNYSISISQKTGTFTEGQQVYLRDNTLNVVYNLTANGPYTFTSGQGTFDNRFNVIYAPALATETLVFEGGSIIISQNESAIIVNSGNATISDIYIYDIRGRMVYSEKGINASVTEIDDLNTEQQMLIVQVTTADGYNISKKIIY